MGENSCDLTGDNKSPLIGGCTSIVFHLVKSDLTSPVLPSVN